MEEDTPSDISSIDLTSTMTPPNCATTNCFITEETNTLKCSMPKCSRLVHFKCSQLPAYQVQIHLNNQNQNQNQKKSSRTKLTFICCNCVEISKDLPSLCQENNEELKNTVRHRDKVIEEYQTLNTKAKSWKNKYDELKNKNIETRTIDDLEKKFHEQMKTLGESIKSSILEEIQSSLTKVEEQVTVAKKSYAEATDTNATKASTPIMANQPCIREFVREARNFELTESADKKRRQANLVIHGVKENDDPGEDQGYVDNLIKFVKAQSKTQTCIKDRDSKR